MLRRLLGLNGLAIASVILFHAAGWGFTAMFSWTHRYLPVTSPNFDQAGSAAYYALRLLEQLCVFSIPAFLFASGVFAAFSFGREQGSSPWRIVRSRSLTLLVPYLVWSAGLFAAGWLHGKAWTPAEMVVTLLTGSVNPAYYFVPLLIQLYLLAPLLTAIARRKPAALLIVTGVFQLLVYLLQVPLAIGDPAPFLVQAARLLPKWFFPLRIFWMSFGIVAGLNLAALRQALVRWHGALLGAAAVLAVIGFFEWEALLRLSGEPWIDHRETLIDGLYGGAVILAFLAAPDIPRWLSKPLEALGPLSFGIYLVHAPVMEYSARAVYHFAPWLLSQQVLLVPLLILAGLGVPLLMMSLVKNTPLRPLSPVLFG